MLLQSSLRNTVVKRKRWCATFLIASISRRNSPLAIRCGWLSWKLYATRRTAEWRRESRGESGPPAFAVTTPKYSGEAQRLVRGLADDSIEEALAPDDPVRLEAQMMGQLEGDLQALNKGFLAS